MNKSICPLLFSVVLLVVSTGCKDDDVVLPKFSASSFSEKEGNDATVFEITLTLSREFNKAVTIDYATSDRSAKAGQDYEAASGTLSFAAGEIEKKIPITILTDILEESDEDFDVLLSNPTNGTLTFNSIRVTILNDDTQDNDAGYTSPDSYPGYTLVWQDEFDGPNIDMTNWTYDLGANGWGNNELQNYTQRTDNSFIADGKLIIEAKKENFNGAQYTSARMKTQGLRDFKYGRIDIRARLPVGQGIWPALWMLGSNFPTVGWPSCGEIDIMEVIGKEPSTLYGTVHWDNNGSYANYGQNTNLPFGETFADEYHVFSIIWDSQSIQWLLDDVQYNVIDITPPSLSEFQEKFFFIFNVAVGGNWPGNPDGTTTFPKRMRVDYVRVFQQ